jgi:hypothetical protein
MKRFMGYLLILFMPCIALAQNAPPIGAVAGELLGPVHILSNFVSNGSIILGTMAIFGAFMRYKQHRINPLAAPMGGVIVLLILGILLICLPFTYLLTGAGIPFPAHTH